MLQLTLRLLHDSADIFEDVRIGQDVQVVHVLESERVYRRFRIARPIFAGSQRTLVNGAVAETHYQLGRFPTNVRFLVLQSIV